MAINTIWQTLFQVERRSQRKYNTNHESGCEFASVPNHEDNSNSLVKHQDKINEIKKNDADYELAPIPKKNESDYVYSDTVEGDYDQLNRKEGRKIKLTGEEDKNFYSHTNCHDGTYNTANTKSNTDDVCDTYNHAIISKRVVCDDNDPYDHTQNIQDTYDHTKISNEVDCGVGEKNPYNHTYK
ncbi:hypothetical protein KUTeg_015433 [Tegillarca granosa]|uniref:Uncharacterized protein n=1 Tax=Tegillarca granosa TaxID=220873 RepID=A0ABQ9EQQ4_TEGGR|nr:hypothetical protein KUTeg_015433 [Tegillarca granosa]